MTQETSPVVVHRPEPGLRRGAFEGPPWLFVGFAAAAVVVAAALLIRLLRRRARR